MNVGARLREFRLGQLSSKPRRNVAVVASHWRCWVHLTGPGILPRLPTPIAMSLPLDAKAAERAVVTFK